MCMCDYVIIFWHVFMLAALRGCNIFMMHEHEHELLHAVLWHDFDFVHIDDVRLGVFISIWQESDREDSRIEPSILIIIENMPKN